MKIDAIIKIVESRRNELMHRADVVEVIDYGAGNPQENRTQEDMVLGKHIKVMLSVLAETGIKGERMYNLYNIITKLNPKTILELGTCCGFSSSYMSFFVPDSKIYTIEGSPNIATIAKENHRFFDLKNISVFEGRFDVVLPELLNKISPIDFAFIDGHHDKEATLKYFRQILPFMSQGGVMLFDDIAWSDGMKEAWREIIDSKQYVKFEDYIKMGAIWL
ncbi:MAG: class I SAM-dependent methyltransferase [Helicobacter sp.]|uniref:O-methyltransferase n=1 Tax=Helicobacter sp. TaxID=218 RepID=UPI002A805295|nr:class I SAM-dependent methyltransferase [Helicobacter sp.]MDY4426227.1 class I SAM-dependent methyltransferase [Helicobacter sp.]